ncbi:unnamed protein product, partial [marine sediment metagenome]
MARPCVRRCVFVLLSGIFTAATASMGGCGRPLAGEATPLAQRIPSVNVTRGAQRDAAWRFSPNCYMAHVHYLASDELGGRGVGTEGIRQATEYIADTFEWLGLTPGGDDDSYFQTFGMKTGAALTEAA